MFFSSVFCCCRAAKLFRRNHSRNSGLVPTYFTHYDISLATLTCSQSQHCTVLEITNGPQGPGPGPGPSHISSYHLRHSGDIRPLHLFTNHQLEAAIIIVVELTKINNPNNNILCFQCLVHYSGHKVISEIAESSDRHSLCCIADITHIISPSLDIMIGNTNTIRSSHQIYAGKKIYLHLSVVSDRNSVSVSGTETDTKFWYRYRCRNLFS